MAFRIRLEKQEEEMRQLREKVACMEKTVDEIAEQASQAIKTTIGTAEATDGILSIHKKTIVLLSRRTDALMQKVTLEASTTADLTSQVRAIHHELLKLHSPLN